jgi:16S rRNA processing protein RimM
MADNFISVAKLRKPHKISGAFRFQLLRELKSQTKFPGHFMIEVKGQVVPFFVKSIEVLGIDEGIIQFEEITTPELAKTYNGKELLLESAMVSKYFKKDSADFDFLIGYELRNAAKEPVGVVTEIVENTMQVFIEVKTAKGASLIPLAEDWILEINQMGKCIVMDFPMELLDF